MHWDIWLQLVYTITTNDERFTQCTVYRLLVLQLLYTKSIAYRQFSLFGIQWPGIFEYKITTVLVSPCFVWQIRRNTRCCHMQDIAIFEFALRKILGNVSFPQSGTS